MPHRWESSCLTPTDLGCRDRGLAPILSLRYLNGIDREGRVGTSSTSTQRCVCLPPLWSVECYCLLLPIFPIKFAHMGTCPNQNSIPILCIRELYSPISTTQQGEKQGYKPTPRPVSSFSLFSQLSFEVLQFTHSNNMLGRVRFRALLEPSALPSAFPLLALRSIATRKAPAHGRNIKDNQQKQEDKNSKHNILPVVSP